MRAFGLNFPNPVGIAAGFDKNAQVPDALLRLGFGFVEVGTVTPQPQAGNPRPRLFRLEADEGVINRLGFNNEGAAAVLKRLAARAGEGGIVGVNIGANRDSADRGGDYVQLIETFAPVASYFTVNVSSPNTPGLRDLQQAKALDDLLARVLDARERVRPRMGPVPVLVKIAPDLTLSDLDDAVGIARKHRVDGMIVGNTTMARPSSLRERDKAKEAGGLSGRPLFKLSTRMLAETFVRAEGAFPLIGVGGVDSGPTAIAKIKAGATLVQLYTGLVYRGIGVVAEIKADLLGGAQARPPQLARLHGGLGRGGDHGGELAGLAPARRVDQAHDDPDRDHDHRAEQEIAPEIAHGVQAHVPDVADQPLDALDDVPRVESERRQDNADQDRYQHQTEQHPQRRAAENLSYRAVAHWFFSWGRPVFGHDFEPSTLFRTAFRYALDSCHGTRNRLRPAPMPRRFCRTCSRAGSPAAAGRRARISSTCWPRRGQGARCC